MNHFQQMPPLFVASADPSVVVSQPSGFRREYAAAHQDLWGCQEADRRDARLPRQPGTAILHAHFHKKKSRAAIKQHGESLAVRSEGLNLRAARLRGRELRGGLVFVEQLRRAGNPRI